MSFDIVLAAEKVQRTFTITVLKVIGIGTIQWAIFRQSDSVETALSFTAVLFFLFL